MIPAQNILYLLLIMPLYIPDVLAYPVFSAANISKVQTLLNGKECFQKFLALDLGQNHLQNFNCSKLRQEAPLSSFLLKSAV